MKWVTREKARVDRIACPWPNSLSVAHHSVHQQGAGVSICASDRSAGGRKAASIPVVTQLNVGYVIWDPALLDLALIVRGADTDARGLTPESAGLYAVASGFRNITRDNFDNMARQFPVYDALYAYCRARRAGTES